MKKVTRLKVINSTYQRLKKRYVDFIDYSLGRLAMTNNHVLPPYDHNLSMANQKELERLMDLIIADNIEALKELAK